MIGTRNNFAVIFNDDAYSKIVLRSSDAVFRCTKGLILIKWPQLCVARQVTVNAAACYEIFFFFINGIIIDMIEPNLT